MRTMGGPSREERLHAVSLPEIIPAPAKAFSRRSARCRAAAAQGAARRLGRTGGARRGFAADLAMEVASWDY